MMVLTLFNLMKDRVRFIAREIKRVPKVDGCERSDGVECVL